MKANPPWSPSAWPFAISFSLVIGPDFSFSLDTRSKEKNSLETKKRKQSPSRLRRNARRREEFAKKKQASLAEIIADDEELAVLKCAQCEYVGASVRGLKQHMRMKHKTSGAPLGSPQHEELRDSVNAEKPLELSPVKDIREELPIEPTFVCYLCNDAFNSKAVLENHYNTRPPNQCRECKVFKPNPCGFFAHTLFHNENTVTYRSTKPGGSS